ncbi:MAG: 50S ribosomal protein L19e [Candidatus Micrarchaeia archaeon]
MSIKFVKRSAKKFLERGTSSIRISPTAVKDAASAISNEDVKALIKDGKIYARKPKHNLSLHGKERAAKRKKGRSRGPGRREGTRKAREGSNYPKKVRSQRTLLKILKAANIITNEQFKKYYRLVKGNVFSSKASIINRMKSDGVQIGDEDLLALKSKQAK